MISVIGMDTTQAGVEIMILKTSVPMKCAVVVREVQVEHAMTQTKASVTLVETNVNGTIPIQAHAEVLIQMNLLLEICAVSVEVELAQAEIGKSQTLVITRSSI